MFIACKRSREIYFFPYNRNIIIKYTRIVSYGKIYIYSKNIVNICICTKRVMEFLINWSYESLNAGLKDQNLHTFCT